MAQLTSPTRFGCGVLYHTQRRHESSYVKKCTEDTAGDPSKTYQPPLKIEHSSVTNKANASNTSPQNTLACYPKIYREAELTTPLKMNRWNMFFMEVWFESCSLEKMGDGR